MVKPNRSTSAPRALKDSGTQLSKNIPELFRTQQVSNHEALQASQASSSGSRRSSSNSPMDGDECLERPFSFLDLQKDLQKVDIDIKHMLTAAITYFKADIHSITHHIVEVEQAPQTHAEAIRQVQGAYDSQLPHIF